MGNTTNYDFKLCEEICEEVAAGKNVIAALDGNKKFPSWSTFRRWKNDNEELRTLYVNAIQDKSEAVLFEIDSIALDLRQGKIEANVANVLIQTLKWKAAKFYPKMFGDKIDHTSGGDKIQASPLAVVLPEGQTMEGVAKEIQDILKNNGSD